MAELLSKQQEMSTDSEGRAELHRKLRIAELGLGHIQFERTTLEQEFEKIEKKWGKIRGAIKSERF